MTRLPLRTDVPLHQTWDLTALYAADSDWEQEALALQQTCQGALRYRGRLGEHPDTLVECLMLKGLAEQFAQRLTCYANCRRDEDLTSPQGQHLAQRAADLKAHADATFAFVDPEAAQLPAAFRIDPILTSYHRYLERAANLHRPTSDGGHVLAQLRPLLDEPRQIWAQVLFADLQCDPIAVDAGKLQPVSLQTLGRFYQSPDRSVRKAAFESVGRAVQRHKHTLTAAIAGAQRRDVALARLSGYPSALTAALAPHELDEALVHALLQGVEAASPHLQRYLSWRGRKLGVYPVQPYDLSIPITMVAPRRYTWDEAWQVIRAALAPLGPEYLHWVDRAKRERWCDWALSQHKSHIPYASDAYGTHPLINIPWNGTPGDLSLLIHELGHAIHTMLAQHGQPFVNSRYDGLLAETAAITNQCLLDQYLIGTAPDEQRRAAYLEAAIEPFLVSYYYSATMTALQVELHAMVERGEPLTFDRITAVNMDFYRRYYGEGYAVTPEGIGSQWLRVPQHFANFYSYQYVAGVSAAALLANRILADDTYRDRYLDLLRAGGSQPPLDLLRQSGVNLSNPETVRAAGERFGALVSQLEELG